MTYNEFFNSLSKGTKYETGVSFKRLNPLPIDPDACFENEAAFTTYLSGGTAYPTQIVCIKEDSGLVYYYLDLDESGNLVKKPFVADTDIGVEFVNLTPADLTASKNEFLDKDYVLKSNTVYQYNGENLGNDVSLKIESLESNCIGNVSFIQPGSFYFIFNTAISNTSTGTTTFYNCDFNVLLSLYGDTGFYGASLYRSKIGLVANENTVPTTFKFSVVESDLSIDIKAGQSNLSSTNPITIEKAEKSKIFVSNNSGQTIKVSFEAGIHDCDVYLKGSVDVDLSKVNQASDIRVHNLNHEDGAFLLQIGGTSEVSGVQDKIEWVTNATGGFKAEVEYPLYNYGKAKPNTVKLPKVRTFTLVGEATNNTYEETYDSPEVEVTTGKITFYSNLEAQMLVLIY